MLKTCCACRANKPPYDFNRKARSKDGRQEICRECSAANSRSYYQNRTESHRAYVRKQRNEKRRELKRRTDELKRRFGCRVCGESDIVCLDFHHRDPNTKDPQSHKRFLTSGRGRRYSPRSASACACVRTATARRTPGGLR